MWRVQAAGEYAPKKETEEEDPDGACAPDMCIIIVFWSQQLVEFLYTPIPEAWCVN